MTYARKQLPKYCRHKSSGQAFVRIGGKMHYLGKFGSQASRQEYDRLIAEFVSNGRQPTQHPDEILVENLIVQFVDHTEKETGLSGGSFERLQRVLRLLNDLYGKLPVVQFSPMLSNGRAIFSKPALLAIL